MFDRRLRRALLALVAAGALLPVVALAAPPKVLVVVGVRAKDRQAYLAKLATYEAVTERLGLPRARVWRATLAGEGTDTLYVVTEYESSSAWAAAQQRSPPTPGEPYLARDRGQRRAHRRRPQPARRGSAEIGGSNSTSLRRLRSALDERPQRRDTPP
jgi:hypothetical protein